MSGCDGVRVCGGELCSRYHVYKISGRGTTVYACSSSDAKAHHRPSYRQEDVSCSLAISGRSAACSLFLADQLLARYFQRQRYCSIMLARDFERSSVATRPRPHARRKYWRNLIWRCVHNPPNRQIKFPAKFSGHTVCN